MKNSAVSVAMASVLAITLGGAGRLAAQTSDQTVSEPTPALVPAPQGDSDASSSNAPSGPGIYTYSAPPDSDYAPTGGPDPERRDAVAVAPAPVTVAAPAPRMPREVIEAASAYETFIDHAATIDAHFSDAGAVSAAMTAAESYQADQLAEGAVAYAALIALQDPGFVDGVRRAGRSPETADALVRALEADPAKVSRVPGADQAALRINTVLADQAQRVTETGRKLRQASYDMQRDDWTRQMTPDGSARLAKAKALSSSPISPTADDITHLFQAATALRDQASAAPGGPPGYTPVVQRGLAIAALALLGRASRDELEATGLTKVRDSAGCMQAAKLNLYQCLAVAGPHYEDVYCISEHALKETGQCLLQDAGAPPAPEPASTAPQPAAGSPAVAPDTYAVPVAVATADQQ